MKICEIVASYGEGGLENHFIELCNGLAAEGHEVHAVIPNEFIKPFDCKVIIHKVPFHLSRKNVILLWRFYKAIKCINPDVIHTHASKATSLMASIKNFISCPSVATIHGKKQEISSYLKMDAVIGVSSDVLKDLDHPNKKVIFNGVKCPSIKVVRDEVVKRFNLIGSRPIIMSIGRLVEVKNFDMLINAWQGVDADLLLIGDGPLKSKLNNQIQALNLASSIHLTGFIDNASALIGAADFIVISSQREGFNYVMAEALCQSIPVISTDVPAPNEIIPKQYLVEVGNSGAMHDLLSESLANLDMMHLGYKDTFSWSAQALSIEAMISETSHFLEKQGGVV